MQLVAVSIRAAHEAEAIDNKQAALAAEANGPVACQTEALDGGGNGRLLQNASRLRSRTVIT